MSNETHVKDPSAVLDYGWDWSDWLQPGEAIASSSWTIDGVSEGLELGTGERAPDHDGIVAGVWVLGGLLGRDYVLKNTITTDATPSRTNTRRLEIRIRKT